MPRIPLFDPARAPMRVVGFASGSGKTLWSALDMSRALAAQAPRGRVPFEIVGVFCDDPAAAAMQTARALGVPAHAIDLRAYYRERDVSLRDRSVRALFDGEAMRWVVSMRPDVILLAGYVWATTPAVFERVPTINVHPADLAVRGPGGCRAYAGADGVGAALAAGETTLRASSHIASAALDEGPLLMVSPPVPVSGEPFATPRQRERAHLRRVNDESRRIGARTLLDLSLGRFACDAAGDVYYDGRLVRSGVRLESWATDDRRTRDGLRGAASHPLDAVA